MENHGINMKGKYFMQSVSNSGSGSASDGRRIIFNTSNNLNGNTDSFNTNKMVFHDGTQWCRPLLSNVSDGPDQNNAIDLGGSSNRFYRIYVGNSGSGGIYGQVRYS
jgi:hypothetical protein